MNRHPKASDVRRRKTVRIARSNAREGARLDSRLVLGEELLDELAELLHRGERRQVVVEGKADDARGAGQSASA